MPNVSVIVPCYNSTKFLSSTIESVLNQKMPHWELILVDDESQDTTWGIIDQYVKLDPRIVGFQKSNGGTAQTRNYGFSKSNTDSPYIFFLDHDDQLEPNALTRLCAYMDSHSDVGILACQFTGISEDGKKMPPRKRSRWIPGTFFPRELRDDEFNTPFVTFFCATGQGPFAIYRRSVYEQTDGWETDFWPHEDTDMFCQMALLSKAHCLPDCLYIKRTHSAQGMSDGARVQHAYGAFREKWDNRQPKNAAEAKILRNAIMYYYSMHRPCRDLLVAKKAFSELLSDPNSKRLHWFGQLITSAFRGFILYRFRTSNF